MSETTPPKAHAERGHHPYGPSGLNNLAASPCFLNRQSTNEAAERGTRQHESVERGEDDPALEDAEADAVRRAMTMVASTKELLTNAGKTVHEFTEQYLPIDDVVVDGWRGTSGGYPDKVLIYESAPGEFWVYVMDWKFGRYAVTPAEYNMQGHAYLLGVRHLLTTGELGGLRGTLKAGTVVFFSPHRGDEPSVHEFTETDFGRMYAAIVDTVAHARIVRAESVAASIPAVAVGQEVEIVPEADDTKLYTGRVLRRAARRPTGWRCCARPATTSSPPWVTSAPTC